MTSFWSFLFVVWIGWCPYNVTAILFLVLILIIWFFCSLTSWLIGLVATILAHQAHLGRLRFESWMSHKSSGTSSVKDIVRNFLYYEWCTIKDNMIIFKGLVSSYDNHASLLVNVSCFCYFLKERLKLLKKLRECTLMEVNVRRWHIESLLSINFQFYSLK